MADIADLSAGQPVEVSHISTLAASIVPKPTEWKKKTPVKTYSKKVVSPSSPSGSLDPDGEGKSRYGRTRKLRPTGDFLSTDRKVSAYMKVNYEDQVISGPSTYSNSKTFSRSSHNKFKRPRSSLPARLPSLSVAGLVDSTSSSEVKASPLDIAAPTCTETIETPLPLQECEPEDTESEASSNLEYQVGDLVWAAVSGYPYWPAMITRDPVHNVTVKLHGGLRKQWHVYFFGDKGFRGWVFNLSLFPFDLETYNNKKSEALSVNESELKRVQDKRACKQQKKLFTISNRYQHSWNLAVSEAQSLIESPRDERLEYFVSTYLTKEEEEPKMRSWSSTVSLAGRSKKSSTTTAQLAVTVTAKEPKKRMRSWSSSLSLSSDENKPKRRKSDSVPPSLKAFMVDETNASPFKLPTPVTSKSPRKSLLIARAKVAVKKIPAKQQTVLTPPVRGGDAISPATTSTELIAPINSPSKKRPSPGKEVPPRKKLNASRLNAEEASHPDVLQIKSEPEEQLAGASSPAELSPTPVKKKRGRPRKYPPSESATSSPLTDASPSHSPAASPRMKKQKKKLLSALSAACVESDSTSEPVPSASPLLNKKQNKGSLEALIVHPAGESVENTLLASASAETSLESTLPSETAESVVVKIEEDAEPPNTPSPPPTVTRSGRKSVKPEVLKPTFKTEKKLASAKPESLPSPAPVAVKEEPASPEQKPKKKQPENTLKEKKAKKKLSHEEVPSTKNADLSKPVAKVEIAPKVLPKKACALFAGVKDTKLCSICFKGDKVVRCRGPCSLYMHVDCADKPRFVPGAAHRESDMNARIRPKKRPGGPGRGKRKEVKCEPEDTGSLNGSIKEEVDCLEFDASLTKPSETDVGLSHEIDQMDGASATSGHNVVADCDGTDEAAANENDRASVTEEIKSGNQSNGSASPVRIDEPHSPELVSGPPSSEPTNGPPSPERTNGPSTPERENEILSSERPDGLPSSEKSSGSPCCMNENDRASVNEEIKSENQSNGSTSPVRIDEPHSPELVGGPPSSEPTNGPPSPERTNGPSTPERANGPSTPERENELLSSERPDGLPISEKSNESPCPKPALGDEAKKAEEHNMHDEKMQEEKSSSVKSCQSPINSYDGDDKDPLLQDNRDAFPDSSGIPTPPPEENGKSPVHAETSFLNGDDDDSKTMEVDDHVVPDVTNGAMETDDHLTSDSNLERLDAAESTTSDSSEKDKNGCASSKKDAKDKGWMCSLCVNNLLGPCFACGKDDGERVRCKSAICGKVFHSECMKEWPQHNLKQNARGKMVFNCPAHTCHTCISDNPSCLTSRYLNDKLVRCMKCPTTYHHGNHCVPAGSEILTSTQIICPRHFRLGRKSLSHLNASWCFLCSMGGSLICCDLCPTAFHVECLKISPPEGAFICEDCETGRFPLFGEIVWVKLGIYRWWPARILFPFEVPPRLLKTEHVPGEFAVRFYGTYDYYWVNRGRVFLFHEGDGKKQDINSLSNSKKAKDEAFYKGVREANEDFIIWNEKRNHLEESHRPTMKPPKYTKITSNKPVGSVKMSEADPSSLTACECSPDSKDPCGPDSDCINRLLLVECDPETCPAKDKCKNRNFEKRLYPPLVAFRTESRGWGLKTLGPLKKGDFVIEYVGEMIDEEEYQRRLQEMQKNKDQNFYFLTLDKDRMLDAGPKGNLARFMNHSCQPNCETQKWTVEGNTRVGLFALHNIPADSELVFNYNLMTTGDNKIECRCGAPYCAGYIGGKPTKPQSKPKDDANGKSQNGRPTKIKKKRKAKKGAKNLAKIALTNSSQNALSKADTPKCSMCNENGATIACQESLCPKMYHLACTHLTKEPKQYTCPSHECSTCRSRSQVENCSLCINSYCNEHQEGNMVINREKGPLCRNCYESDSGSEWSTGGKDEETTEPPTLANET